jgi:hypothetical protein
MGIGLFTYQAASDPPRRQALQHSHQPRRRRQNV